MDTTREEWRPVVGFEGRYEVSNLGAIRRAAGYVDKYGRTRRERPRKMSPTNSYRIIKLTDANWKSRSVLVHIVVATAFLGSRPNGMEINHKDGNKTNNAASNLEYVTRAQNLFHARDLRLKRGQLTKQQVEDVKIALSSGERPCHIARRLGISGHSVYRIRYGQSWRDLEGNATVFAWRKRVPN